MEVLAILMPPPFTFSSKLDNRRGKVCKVRERHGFKAIPAPKKSKQQGIKDNP